MAFHGHRSFSTKKIEITSAVRC